MRNPAARIGCMIGRAVGRRLAGAELLLGACWFLGAGACASGAQGREAKNSDGYETLELRAEGSPGSVSFAELAEDLGYLAPIKLKYVGSSISGPANIQNVVTGDTDYGGAFNGAI